MEIFLKNPIFTPLGFNRFNPSQTQFRNVIICAKKRRQQPFLNRKVTKLVIDTALSVASNLNVVPPTVASLIREFGGGGSGGGLGSRRGGGGGFGWSRKRLRNLGFMLLLVVIGLRLLAGRSVCNDAVLCGIGVVLVGGLIGFLNVRLGDLVFGFCSCVGVVLLLGQRREELIRIVGKFRNFAADSGIMKLMAMPGRKTRRSF